MCYIKRLLFSLNVHSIDRKTRLCDEPLIIIESFIKLSINAESHPCKETVQANREKEHREENMKKGLSL